MGWDIFVQVIGFLGVACFFGSFQVKSNRGLMLWQTMGNLMFLIQFILLGAYSGTFGCLIGVTRNFLLSKREKWTWIRSKWIAAAFIGVATLTTALTWNGPISILPWLAITGGTIGYWTDNAQYIRLANLVCCSPSWIIYDFLVGSIGGVLNECIVIGSVLISIYRYGWKQLGDNTFDGKK